MEMDDTDNRMICFKDLLQIHVFPLGLKNHNFASSLNTLKEALREAAQLAEFFRRLVLQSNPFVVGTYCITALPGR